MSSSKESLSSRTSSGSWGSREQQTSSRFANTSLRCGGALLVRLGRGPAYDHLWLDGGVRPMASNRVVGVMAAVGAAPIERRVLRAGHLQYSPCRFCGALASSFWLLA